MNELRQTITGMTTKLPSDDEKVKMIDEMVLAACDRIDLILLPKAVERFREGILDYLQKNRDSNIAERDKQHNHLETICRHIDQIDDLIHMVQGEPVKRAQI